MPEGSQEFLSLVTDITNLRIEGDAVYGDFIVARETHKLAEAKFVNAQERGLDTSELQNAVQEASDTSQALGEQLHNIQVEERARLDDLFSFYPQHASAVGQLNDAIPVLFFPVRIETVFEDKNGLELWVRIFPDDIAIDTHENLLTEDEIAAGKAYWESWVVAATNTEKLQAWDVLSRAYSHQRAAWIVLQTTPTNIGQNPLPAPDGLLFPTLTPKGESWVEQPVTRILPDAFVVYCYNSTLSVPTYIAQTLPIDDEVKVGIDPGNEDTFASSNGEVVSNDVELDWLLDFDAAVDKGLGLKISLSQRDYDNGFERIVVLGVKASLTAAASQARLEELINHHHYTDGFSLLKQGTSTNNTETAFSGYSSVDLGNPVTHATEREGPLFTPVAATYYKRDGQILCEALGIEYDPLYNIFQSNGLDIQSAMQINNALWQVSIGYYASDMLDPVYERTMDDDLRDFFTDYVRSRGALPSIRSGTQPYGILPTSVYSRINWGEDPRAGLYRRLRDLSQALSGQWMAQVDGIVANIAENPGQNLSDILSHSAVSVDYMQRTALGPGYVWNSLAYDYETSASNGLFEQWEQEQASRMSLIEEVLQMKFDRKPRIAQLNFLENQFPIQLPLVAPEGVHEDAQLPLLAPDHNYLQLIARASFRELRDGNYNVLHGEQLSRTQPLLYHYSRQSILLEYFNAASRLLGIPDEQRISPELVNMEVNTEGGEEFSLYAGPSRWAIMETPFQGYETIGDFLSSDEARERRETENLFKAKDGLEAISSQSVRNLRLLTSEVVDATAYRLDTWRLALVNQRLNALRGITEGSLNRNKGIYLGAYGWVENIRKRGSQNPVAPPTSNFAPPIEEDTASYGFIHAPSINQAVTGAVLRSGYMTRSDAAESAPLSINLSSERVRAALLILEGIRNGQELGVLLGYELERRLHENYPVSLGLDYYIFQLRQEYALDNTIVSYGTTSVDLVKSRNVINGIAIIDAYRQTTPTLFKSSLNAILDPDPSSAAADAIVAEVDWIWNLMDATGDLTTAEGAFHIVQGNPSKASGIMDAISKGSNVIADMDVVQTPKTGTYVNHRFTFHVSTDNIEVANEEFDPASGWEDFITPRVAAEPYLNRWLGTLLGEPQRIKCKVTAYADTPDEEEFDISLADLELSALDFVLIINEELRDDDSDVAKLIRRRARADYNYPRATPLTIDFGAFIDDSDEPWSFAEIHALARATRDFITACRPLNTRDYIIPEEADGVNNEYDLEDFYLRVTGAVASLDTAYQELSAAYNVVKNLPVSTIPSTVQFDALKNALHTAGFFDLAQTLYEFRDETMEDRAVLEAYADAVLTVAGKKLGEITGVNEYADYNSIAAEGRDAYIERGREILRVVFGKSFNAIPLFSVRGNPSYEEDTLNGLISASPGQLLEDYTTGLYGENPYLMDEWVSSVARIRKNAAQYELLSILSSVVDADAFSGSSASSRKVAPLQLPYNSAPASTDRWLGAAVWSLDSIKTGRTVYGASLPASHSFSDKQAGLMIDEWVDAVPNEEETTGVAFHQNQPNAKAPQCLLLGLTPVITGSWQWDDLVDMINETFDMAKSRAVTYEQITETGVGQIFPGMIASVTLNGAEIGLDGWSVVNP